MKSRNLAFLLVAGLSIIGCGKGDPPKSEDERLPRLETITPTRTRLPIRLELAATVEPFQKADLCARVPGVVTLMAENVDIGRAVKENEELLKLDVPELNAQLKHKEAMLAQTRKQKILAEASLIVANKEVDEAQKQEKRYAAELSFRKLEHERVTELVRRNALQPERSQETQKQLDVADAAVFAAQALTATRQAKVKAVEAELQVALSRIEVATAEVNNLNALVGLATIRAPFNGVITKRWVDKGATIKDAGAPLLTVMETDRVRVLIDVPERHVPLVSALAKNPNPDLESIVVTIPSLRDKEHSGRFPGSITRVSSALDLNTRTMRSEIHLDNKKGYLRPGMFGTARILADRSYVLTIPSTALVRRGEDVEVYYVDNPKGDPPQGVVQSQKVEIGQDDGIRVEIRNGLTGKELIIAKGNGVVRQGDKVIAIHSNGNGTD